MMKGSVKLIGLTLALAAMLGLSGCGGGTVGSGKVYYLSHNDTGSGFNEELKQAFLAQAQAAGVSVDVLNAKNDSNTQLDNMNEAIENGAAAIVLAAVDGEAIVPAVQKANEAGIGIVRVNRDIADGKFVAAISDDREAGIMQGEYMAKNLPQGAAVLYMGGEMTQGVARQRWEGFKEACLDKRSDVKLLAAADCSWNKAEALKQMTLWLKVFPKVEAVVCANDDMALGAVQALKDAGRLQGVWISGVDATATALKAVQAGTMSQTVMQDAKGQGEAAWKLVQAIARGEKPSQDLIVPFVSITRDNIVQFLK